MNFSEGLRTVKLSEAAGIRSIENESYESCSFPHFHFLEFLIYSFSGESTLENYKRRETMFRYMFEKVVGHIVKKKANKAFIDSSFLLFIIHDLNLFSIQNLFRFRAWEKRRALMDT